MSDETCLFLIQALGTPAPPTRHSVLSRVEIARIEFTRAYIRCIESGGGGGALISAISPRSTACALT